MRYILNDEYSRKTFDADSPEEAGYEPDIEEPDFMHQDLDGRFNRLLPEGTLEIRDPNDGWGDPAKALRHQYKGFGGSLWKRTLPPEGADSFRDSPGNGEFEEPWRIVVNEGSIMWSLIREFSEWSKEESNKRKPFDTPLPRYEPGQIGEEGDEIVVEETPNGRFIFFWKDEGVYAVQPKLDNYFEKFESLVDARLFVRESFGENEQQGGMKV